MIPKRDVKTSWLPYEIDEFLWTRSSDDGLVRELDELRPWFWAESEEDPVEIGSRRNS